MTEMIDGNASIFSVDAVSGGVLGGVLLAFYWEYEGKNSRYVG